MPFDALGLALGRHPAKGIVLFNYMHQYPDETQRTFNAAGTETRFILSKTNADNSEAIVRLELNWAGWEDHAAQLNVEGALNILDKTLIQTTERPGAVPVVEPVPGGNVRVARIGGLQGLDQRLLAVARTHAEMDRRSEEFFQHFRDVVSAYNGFH